MNVAIEALKSQLYDVYGLRVVHNPFGDICTVKVGEVLEPSYRWEDGEPTDDQLYGTSAVEVDQDNFEARLKRLQKEYGCLGSQIVLIAGYHYEWGEDVNEVVIRQAKVIATL